MKRIRSLLLLCLMMLLTVGCSQTTPAAAQDAQNGLLTVTFDFQKQSGYASNQFAVWIENEDGSFIKTLYATRFTAKGGYRDRPDAIRHWVECSKLQNMTEADALTGATPKSGTLSYSWDMTDAKGARVPDGTYRFCVEGTLRWKNSVLFTGEIETGKNAASVEAAADYHYEASADQAALTDESSEHGMIGPVTAQYTPPDQP